MMSKGGAQAFHRIVGKAAEATVFERDASKRAVIAPRSIEGDWQGFDVRRGPESGTRICAMSKRSCTGRC